MAALEIVSLDPATPQLEVPQAGDTYSAPRPVAISAGTVTTAVPALDASQTWNGSGVTFTGIKYNVTDTASNAASLLMDLQVGSASRFSVGKVGTAIAGDSAIANLALTSPSGLSSGGGISFNGQEVVVRRSNGNHTIFNSNGINLALSNGAFILNADTILARDAADTLAQRRTTNAQTFRIYNTFTDASNHERGKIEWASNVLRIGTEKAGSGTARALELQTDGVTRLTIADTGAITATGNITTNASFITQSNRYYFANGTGAIHFNTGRIILSNNAGLNDVGLVVFGNFTSSFPALKRDTVRLQARLADDSAFTNIQGKITTEANAVTETITPDKTLTLYDAAGTAYKVPCVAA